MCYKFSRAMCLLNFYLSRGELFDYIVRHQRLQEGQACFFFRQLVRAAAVTACVTAVCITSSP